MFWNRALPPIALRVWHAVALIFLLTVPGRWLLGASLLALPAAQQPQVWVWGLAFLVLLFSLYDAPRAEPGVMRVAIHGIVVFALAAGVLLLLGWQTSLKAWAVVVPAALLLAMLPQWLGKWLLPAAVVLALATAGSAVAGRPPQNLARGRPMLVTALHNVEVREYAGLIPHIEKGTTGGGLTPWGNGFLLVSGDGRFFRLDWNGPHGDLTATQLPLSAPLNRARFLVDAPKIREQITGGLPLRTLDVIIDTLAARPRLYLAHQYWHAEQWCLTIRVSAIDIPAADAPTDTAWTTVYETLPCVAPAYDLIRGGTAARLAWLEPATLLLSVGDHAQGGERGLEGPQDPNSPYGKILKLHTSGRVELYSMGHRNTQGLAVAADGRVWSTEHGPQGGDEVNRIVPRGNYGWPLATYGVQYGQDTWPLAAGKRDHGEFVEPALAFVPSIGISNLIAVSGTTFPAWTGDLLVSSLRDASLHRLRTRDDRILYDERIHIGPRIRDIKQGKDGRILMWTDAARILVLSRAAFGSPGERAYAACVGCHGAALEGTPLGPPLRGVVGKRVASDPGFNYSPALRQVGGTWTIERLHVFLNNPNGFAEGTSMNFPGVPDSIAFRLIGYLRAHAGQNQ